MRKERIMSRGFLVQTVLVSFVLSYVLFFAVPVQTYLSNSYGFDCTLSSVLQTFGCVAICVFIGLFFLLRFLLSLVGFWGHVFALGISFSVYLETGILSIGLPVLNGDFSGYNSCWRTIVDSLIWILPIVILIAAKRFTGRYYFCMPAVVLVILESCAFFDVNRNHMVDISGSLSGNFVSDFEVVDSVEYSKKKNVFLFIVDAASIEVVKDVFANNPDVAKKFVGFVNYTNNVGMQWYTSVAVPAILTGNFIEHAADMSKYGKSHWGSESLIYPYVKGNCAVYVNVTPGPSGGTKSFTNRKKSDAITNNKGSPFTDKMYGLMPCTILEIACFRSMPYGFKARYALKLMSRNVDGTDKGNSQGLVWDDRVLWPMLGTRRVDEGKELTLNVQHSNGAHLPILFNAKGETVNIKKPTYNDYYQQASYVFKLIGEYLDSLRSKGIYDCSYIIVASDHAIGIKKNKEEKRELPDEAYAFLMVKSRDSANPYSESSLPTSHVGISEVIKFLRNHDATAEQVAEMLTKEKRICRMTIPGKIIDWIVDPHFCVRKIVSEDREPERNELEVLEDGKVYNFAPNMPDNPSFSVVNASRQSTVGVNHAGNPMLLVFKTKHKNKILLVNLTGSTWEFNQIHIDTGHDSHSFKADEDGWVAFKFDTLRCKSDNDGIVEIKMTSSAQSYGFVLRTLEICVQ